MKTNITELLKEYDIKPSPQRVAVVEYLMTHHTHPTAEDIYMALSPSMPTLSKTTVYNTLNLLASQGAILALDIDRDNVRYDGNAKPHAHFGCENCGMVYDIPITNIENLKSSVADKFLVTEIQVYYKGICSNCFKAVN